MRKMFTSVCFKGIISQPGKRLRYPEFSSPWNENAEIQETFSSSETSGQDSMTDPSSRDPEQKLIFP